MASTSTRTWAIKGVSNRAREAALEAAATAGLTTRYRPEAARQAAPRLFRVAAVVNALAFGRRLCGRDMMR